MTDLRYCLIIVGIISLAGFVYAFLYVDLAAFLTALLGVVVLVTCWNRTT